MQSTGHTSTQERSFKPMQGSAMMYGMRVLGCLFTPLAGPNRKHRLGPPPVKCASRSRFAPAANAGTQRLVGTARCLRSDNRTPRMPRRPNAILMRDSVSVVGMLVLIVACYHVAAARRDVTRSSPTDAGRLRRRPHGCDGAGAPKTVARLAAGILSGILDAYGYHSGDAQEGDAGRGHAGRTPAPGPGPRARHASGRAMSPRSPRLIDLSHTIEHGMVTYKGLPAPVIGDWLSRDASSARYAPGTTFQIGKIGMLANTGTYIDAPFHRFEDGKDIAAYPLEAVADLPGVVIRAIRRDGRALDAPRLRGRDLKGKAVLLHTGWDAHWRTDRYASGHPFLTRAAAEVLADGGAGLVGIDSLNIDDDTDGTRPAHTILLGAGIPIVQPLCGPGELPDQGFRFFAVPAKVKGLGSFPVRAFGLISGTTV